MNFDTFLETLQSSLGGSLPQIVGALAILVLGWLLAVLARAATRRVLRLAGVNRHVAQSTATKLELEKPIAAVVFWLIMLATLVAALNALDLTLLSAPIANMVQDVVAYIPHLLAGAVLAVVAWLLATALRMLVNKALDATTLDERIVAEAGMQPISKSAGNVLFWLVILFFLPAILGALQLHGVLDPVRDLLGDLLGYLPGILGAAIIGTVGYFIARIVRTLVTNLLTAAGSERLNQLVGLDNAVRLPRLAGTVVFIIIFVPALIAALDALKIEAISGPAVSVLEQMLAAVPHIIAAAVILLLTWYVAKFAVSLLTSLLESAGFDSLPEKLGMGHALSGNWRPSRLVGHIVMFFALLFATVEAAAQLGFAQVSDVVTAFINFGGDILLGSVILAIGFWLSGVAANAIRRASPEGGALPAHVARFAILGLVIAMGLRAMGIANEIVQLAFGLTLGSVAVAVALAFGLGAREAAGKLASQWVEKLNKKD